MDLTRRSVLKHGAGAVALGTLAGCLSEPNDDSASGNGDDNPNYSGYAAFFTLWDWSQQVGGDQFDFENPVDVGQIGHGWSPTGGLTRDVASSEVFVYLDTPEFAWAQNVADQLERDYDDVAVVDGLDGMTNQMLPWGGSDFSDIEPDRDHDFDPDDLTIYDGGLVSKSTGDLVADWHVDHWHGGLPDIPVGGSLALSAAFEDDDGNVLPVGEDEQFQLDATIADGAQEGVLEFKSEGGSVELTGSDIGRTEVVFQLVADGEVVWESDPISSAVLESVDDEYEFYDPHVWVDPVLAQDIVATIADSLADIDPDNAETYQENAADYTERLESVDEQFRELVDDAELDVAVLAGHDSFQYVEHRYGFELYTPVGVSPEESASQTAIADTIEFVDDHGIDTILYDTFEAPDEDVPPLAESIVENSDATDAEPLSPAEGTTAQWNEDGWGWVEQMEELNLPAFRKALNAE